MILPIYTLGQPVLRKVAEDITPEYPELGQLIQNMYDTLEKTDGIGLAAPQVGLSIRLLIVNLDPLGEDMPEYKGFVRTYINAHILEYDETEKISDDEGCLSLPGLHEKVTRPTRILVRYCDEDFHEHEEWVDGYLARVLQHEIDHLEGKVYTDHLTGLRRQLMKNKLNALLKGKFSCDYKVKFRR